MLQEANMMDAEGGLANNHSGTSMSHENGRSTAATKGTLESTKDHRTAGNLDGGALFVLESKGTWMNFSFIFKLSEKIAQMQFQQSSYLWPTGDYELSSVSEACDNFCCEDKEEGIDYDSIQSLPELNFLIIHMKGTNFYIWYRPNLTRT